jgi:hypothetical protein
MFAGVTGAGLAISLLHFQGSREWAFAAFGDDPSIFSAKEEVRMKN